MNGRLRKLLFWCHLTAGLTTGLVILVMSVTGALLAFEPQILAILERDVRSVELPGPAAERIDTAHILSAAYAYKRDAVPTGLTLSADPTASAAVVFGREDAVYVDPYTGKVLGVGAPRARARFQTLTSWHRWLGVEGRGRATARAITGASNAAFLFLAMSGLYLWLPRSWTRRRIKAVTLLDVHARGKARDYNWHNVAGFRSAPVLILLTATAVVMSYPWANNLLYRMMGSTPPAAGVSGGPGAAGQGGGRGGGRPARGGEGREDLRRDRRFAAPGICSCSWPLPRGTCRRGER